jgi:hypothetical protein
MNESKKSFTRFVNISLKVLMIILIIKTLTLAKYLIENDNRNTFTFITTLCLIIFTTIIILIVKFYFFKKEQYSRSVIFLVVVGFLLRLAWIFMVRTKPVSDFDSMMQFGGLIANGDYSMFKGIQYIARFPHLTTFCLFLGFIYRFFSDPLLTMKLINVLLSTFNIYLIYIISKELYTNVKKAVYTALIATLFPVLIIYTSVICSENIAMTFYLLSLYYFIKVMKNKKSPKWLLLSGFILLIGSLFRAVAPVILVAYILYTVLYYRSNVKKQSLKSVGYIVASFLIPFVLFNYALKAANIIEFDLWKGSEPSITSVLKGTNIENKGMWNPEDAAIFEKYNANYDAIEKASLEVIKERLTTTPPLELIAFYITKFSGQWSFGDFASLSWATDEVTESTLASENAIRLNSFIQLSYSILLLMIFIGLFNKRYYKGRDITNIIYIIFCGYILFYLISEMQPRYAYIVCWIFVFLPCTLSYTDIKKWFRGQYHF